MDRAPAVGDGAPTYSGKVRRFKEKIMNEVGGDEGRGRSFSPVSPGAVLAALVLVGLVLALPLMMGHRTSETLTTTALLLVSGALLAVMVTFWQGAASRKLSMPSTGWWLFFWLMTLIVLLQVLPSRLLAEWLGPYPDALWQHPAFEPRQWSPHPAATLRGWAVFVALFAIAWVAGSLRTRQRNWLWLAICAMALFQALYGLTSHAAGTEKILGIWDRHNIRFVHGTFSNRNLFAGYLALTWPLVIAVWWLREVPLLERLPVELRIAGSIISGAIIGAALMASASRLGATAGLAGMLCALLLWTSYRGHLKGGAIWPAWVAAFAAFLFATWYGLGPLTDRLASSPVEDIRFEVYSLMLTEFPRQWWLAGVGLGGFEAVFKQIQPDDLRNWWDYAHNDLLQWLLEMGLVGVILLGMVLAATIKHASICLERIPLYAGLVALCLVGLGDFSWHIPGTQVVLAIYIGVVARPSKTRIRRRKGEPEIVQ